MPYSESTGAHGPSEILIKVGRETRLNNRVNYWSKHYDSAIRPFFHSSEARATGDTSTTREELQKVGMVSVYKRLERLIQIELEDLVQHAAYHDPAFPKVEPPLPRLNRGTMPCLMADCT